MEEVGTKGRMRVIKADVICLIFFRPQSVVMCVYVSGTGGKIEKKLNFRLGY